MTFPFEHKPEQEILYEGNNGYLNNVLASGGFWLFQYLKFVFDFVCYYRPSSEHKIDEILNFYLFWKSLKK